MSVAPPTTTTPISIESCDLWIPSGGVSHAEWLTRLVTALIDSGAIEDDVLSLTRNVCSVKVYWFAGNTIGSEAVLYVSCTPMAKISC